MQQYWSRQEIKRHWVGFIGGVLLFTLVLASLPNGLGQADQLIADFAARLDKRKPSPDIAIVAIDDESILALGRWPWKREIYAQFLDKLRHADIKAIGLDILLDRPDQMSPASDQALSDAIVRNGQVTLPLFMFRPAQGGGWIEVVKPLESFSKGVRALAHINLQPDIDGKVRRIYLREGRDGAAGGFWDHMALALYKNGSQPSAGMEIPGRRAPSEVAAALETIDREGIDPYVLQQNWLRDYEILIPYVDSPGVFQRYSYIDIYSGAVPIEQLKGKYVLVGVTATGLGDIYPTPMAGEDVLMPGVEIIANVLDGLVQKEYRYPAKRWQNIIYNLFPVLLALPLFYFGKPRTIIIGLVFVICADLAIMFLLRRYGGIQVMPAASLIGLMLSYPWWSWRRLELSMRQIEDEFSRMRRENGFFQAPKVISGDRLERDLQEFNNAAWQLRKLQQMVRSSLDEMPYVLLITDEHTRVILSNEPARKFFYVDPPLPTMAFEPAMGFEMCGLQRDIPQHHLVRLLKNRFLKSLQQQWQENAYAQQLLLFLGQSVAFPPKGSIEVSDSRDGRFYSLKIVSRGVSEEQKQGWLVTLVTLSGEQHAEKQRDQLLRYLYDNINPQLEDLMRSVFQTDKTKKGIGFLRSQTNAFLEFEYAQIAIYYYEKVDLGICVKAALEAAKIKLKRPQWDLAAFEYPLGILVDADMHLLSKACEDLIVLLTRLARSEAMPIIRLDVSPLDGDVHDGGENLCQITFGFEIKDKEGFAQRCKFLTEPMQRGSLPVRLNPKILGWWAIQFTVMRHGGRIKVRKAPGLLQIIIELEQIGKTQNATISG